MAISEAAISSATADDAREELEGYNRDAIAAAKASGRVLPLDLKAPSSSTKLQRAYTESETAIRKTRPTASLRNPRPVLFLSRPPMHVDSLHVSACLALGKMGGEEEEIGVKGPEKGNVFVWERGEKQEFGDADVIYIGFKVEETSA